MIGIKKAYAHFAVAKQNQQNRTMADASRV